MFLGTSRLFNSSAIFGNMRLRIDDLPLRVRKFITRPVQQARGGMIVMLFCSFARMVNGLSRLHQCRICYLHAVFDLTISIVRTFVCEACTSGVTSLTGRLQLYLHNPNIHVNGVVTSSVQLGFSSINGSKRDVVPFGEFSLLFT